jgi:hypothetical protein
VGVFNYDGIRKGDPNDRVDHQHRRELRGLRVIGSWMNDADRRAANTLDMYVTEEDDRRYIRHYLIDMGSAFGSNNMMPHPPKYGNEYVWDPRTVFLSIAALGFYRKGWEEPLPMQYPSVGYFENETFRPRGWSPTYPNPAFERCTNRDGYWGAKSVMAFTDEQIRAIVETGQYSDPGAAAELTRLLIERRDMIGRYWFVRVNPLDHFAFDEEGLRFVDLAVEGGLESGDGRQYQYQQLDHKGGKVGGPQLMVGTTRVPINGALAAGQFHGYQIHSRTGKGHKWSKDTRVYFYKGEDGRYQIVRLDREE